MITFSIILTLKQVQVSLKKPQLTNSAHFHRNEHQTFILSWERGVCEDVQPKIQTHPLYYQQAVRVRHAPRDRAYTVLEDFNWTISSQ